jgi:hypothetical protein
LIVAGSLGVLACTGGPGGAFLGLGGDGNPATRESPGPGQENPGGSENARATNEPAAAAPENPGTQGGGAGGCPPCDQSFKCTTTTSTTNSNGQTTTKSDTSTVTLHSSGAGCETADKDPSVLTCDGKVLSGGQQVGTWSGNGSGFTASASGAGQGGTVSLTITCTPGQVDQGSSGGSSGTSVDASLPPDDAGVPTPVVPPPVDAGF